MDIEQAIKKGILQNKKVRLKPILKPGKMIKDPKHIGYFMFNDAFKNYVLPRDRHTGSYKPILTKEELEFFSQELQMDLSFTKKVDNFWDKYSVRVVKNDLLMKEGLTFDLSDPYNNLDYRIFKSLKLTAPSYEARGNSPKYKWYLAEENEELRHEAKEIEKTKDLWIYFGSIQNSKKKLMDILSVYYAEKSRSNEIDVNATIEWFNSEVSKLIHNEPEFVLKCMNDDSFTIKAFIIDGVRSGAINKTGRNKYNIIGDSSNYDYIGLTNRLISLKEISDDDYIRISEQIEKYLKDKKL